MSEQRQQDLAQQSSPSSAEVLDWPSPGARLRKMRDEQQLSQAEVAERLHLTVHYINALEQDDYRKLPGRVFIKGYMRSYATLLGADPEELVAWYERFTAAHEASLSQEQEEVRRQRRRQDQSRIWLVGAALILVVFVGLSWWFAEREDSVMNSASTSVVGGVDSEVERSDPLAVERAAAAGDTGTATETEQDFVLMDVALEPPDSGSADFESGLRRRLEQTDQGRIISLEGEGEDLIDIMTHGRSWIEVDNGEGERLFNDILQEGDELHIRSNGPFSILFGDASQVAMDFNDEPVDLKSMIRSDNSARVVLER